MVPNSYPLHGIELNGSRKWRAARVGIRLWATRHWGGYKPKRRAPQSSTNPLPTLLLSLSEKCAHTGKKECTAAVVGGPILRFNVVRDLPGQHRHVPSSGEAVSAACVRGGFLGAPQFLIGYHVAAVKTFALWSSFSATPLPVRTPQFGSPYLVVHLN
jgi:hypothetical protein